MKKRLYNHYFPTPEYLAMNSCAIDISDQSIKYGELKITSEGLQLQKYGKEKIPKGVVVSGKIENDDELIKILKTIKNKENLNFIRVSLPEEQMYLFTLSIPKTSNENIRDMILLQIEGYVPLKAPDVVFDFDIIEDDNKNLLIEVVAIAISTLDSYLSVFSRAELVPVSFEIEAQALARAVIPSGEAGPVMIVDLGDSRTGVSISKNGRVYLTTTLSFGGADITNMIAKNFSLSFEEAEKMKHGYGLNTASKAENIFPAILNGLSVLRDELTKQCVYWENHNNNNPNHEKINHIFLCGGDANLTGLSEYLEISMKIKVENANVWVNILNIDKLVPEMSFEESLGYATVLGLDIGGYIYKSQPVINILPEEEKKIINKEYFIRFSVAVLNMAIIVGLISTLLLFPPYFLSKSKEALVQDQLENLNKNNPDITNNNIDKITKDINAKLQLINNSNTPYQVNELVFNNILSSRIEGITFSQILFNKNDKAATLEIRGIATNRDTLRNFKNTLDSNPTFSDVNLPISNFLEKSDLSFSISMAIK